MRRPPLAPPFWARPRGITVGLFHAWLGTGSMCGAFRTPPTQADVSTSTLLRPRSGACNHCARAVLAYKANQETEPMPDNATPHPGPDFYASTTPPVTLAPPMTPDGDLLAKDLNPNLRWAATKPPTPTFQASTRDVLIEFPGKVRRARAEEWGLRTQIERLQFEAKLEEAKVAGSVAREVTTDPATGKEKARYSNQDARDAETRARLVEHEPVRALRLQLDETRRRLAAVEASVECFRDMQRNARVLELAEAKAAAVFDVTEEGL